MNLSENVQNTIATARVYPEGCWLFIPVKGKADVQAVYELLALKAKG